jgi:hypothetical protein
MMVCAGRMKEELCAGTMEEMESRGNNESDTSDTRKRITREWHRRQICARRVDDGGLGGNYDALWHGEEKKS